MALLMASLVRPMTVVAQEVCPADMELLREVEFDEPKERPVQPYGITPGRRTLSPLYHVASAGMYVWENVLAPEVSTRGGYSDTNESYFKALVAEYGWLRAVIYSFDRVVRNTRIGRHTTPTNDRGLIDDSVERYRFREHNEQRNNE